MLLLLSGCGTVGGPPPTPVVVTVTAPPIVVTAAPPSPIIVVVTATAGMQAAATPAPVAASSPSASPTTVAQVKPTGPAPTPTIAPQTLQVGRTNSYRGLLVTVEEAQSGQSVERMKANLGKSVVGLRTRLQNPSGVRVHFAGGPFTTLARLKLPDGALVKAEESDPLARPNLGSQDGVSGWLYFIVEKPVPLESLALVMGGSQEAAVDIALSGPEPKIARRTFEYLRSTEPVRGLIWSVSGGEIRFDVPGQQANPGQEFIVVNLRATNPTANTVSIKGPGSIPQTGPEYLRIRADNGVLLQVSVEISKMPTDFPGKAEQDTQYAWQLPIGSKNPKLVILAPDGSEHELELGPLPPP